MYRLRKLPTSFALEWSGGMAISSWFRRLIGQGQFEFSKRMGSPGLSNDHECNQWLTTHLSIPSTLRLLLRSFGYCSKPSCQQATEWSRLTVAGLKRTRYWSCSKGHSQGSLI